MTFRDTVIQAFLQEFGIDPVYLTHSPDRVNIIGEHTDYNDGFVLPMAINYATWIALRPRQDNRVVVTALDKNEKLDFDLDTFSKGEAGWREYISGVAWALGDARHELKGWEGVFSGNIPIGVGLSSSAALELAVARDFSLDSDLPWDPVQMALTCQKAENHWVGVRSDIMDHLISVSVKKNYALPAFMVVGLAGLNLVGALIWLPKSLPPEKRTIPDKIIRPEVSFRALLNVLRRPCVGPLLNVILVHGLAFTIFQIMFSLFTQQKLGFTAQATSYVLTYVGVLVVLVQGGGIRWLSANFTDKQLIFGGAILLSVGLLGWAFSNSLTALLISLLPLALASGMLRVSTNSALTKSAAQSEVGGILGLSAAMNSFTQVIAPLLGSFLLAQISPAAPGVVGALLMGGVALLIWTRILNVPDLECEQEAE